MDVLKGEASWNEKEISELFIPKGGGIVARSSNFVEIIERVLSGWTLSRIAKWLVVNKGEKISESSLRNYVREHIPDKYCVPSSYIRQKYDHINIKIDELKSLSELIEIQYNRVSRMIEREDAKKVISPAVRLEIMALKDLYKQHLEMRKELGLLEDEKARKRKGLGSINVNKVISMVEKLKSDN